MRSVKWRTISALTLALVVSGELSQASSEECASCGKAQFPEAQALLEARGFPARDYELLLAWTEAAPRAPEGVAAGYRLKPRQGSAFDLYADLEGALLNAQDAMDSWGVKPKDWTLKPRAVDTEPAPSSPAALPRAPRPHALAFRLKALPPALALAPLDLAPVLEEDSAQGGALPKGVKRIGVYRDLPQPLRMTQTEPGLGVWQELPDGGRLWRATVESPDALGQRVHFSALSLPEGAQVLVYNAEDPQEAYGPYTAVKPGEDGLWSATCFSSRVTLECYVPAGAVGKPLEVAADKVVHVYLGLGEVPWAKAAGGCNLDVSCSPAWAETAKGVGGLGTLGQSGFLWCTGTLIADGDPSTSVPYFLTAHHCVGGQGEASTLEIYWLYQTPSCGGEPPNPRDVPRTTGGADYLAGTNNNTGTDFTLLRLRNTPPAGISFVGWETQATANQTAVTCIHHPDGDYKRISFGHVNQSVPPQFGMSATRFYGVYWDQGVTEPGSSGSPLFNTGTGRIIGQLFGGNSSCAAPNEPDIYGRFDVTYPLVQSYLAGVFRIVKPNGGELWQPGSTQEILWLAGSDTAAPVKIELMRSASPLLVIAASTGNDGSYLWDVPAELPEAADYKARITSLTNSLLTDESDASFAIGLSAKILVTSPAGGEKWSVGSQHTIQWASLGVTSPRVRIELRKGGTTVLTVIADTENDGSFTWVIPEDISGSADYIIWIGTLSGQSYADDSNPFTISNEPTITVVKPNGGEVFHVGTSMGVEWFSNALANTSVTIQLVHAAQPTAPVFTLVDSTPNNGGYLWPIPEDFITADDYLVRIVSLSLLQVSGLSDAPFSIIDCAPDTPRDVSATDGIYADRVRVEWTPVASATGYRIYRSTENDPANAEPMSWWIASTYFDDFTVDGPTGSGCAPAGAGQSYYYWVRAHNDCAESGLSGSDSGYRRGGSTAKGAPAAAGVFSSESVGDTLLTAVAALALIVVGRFGARRRQS